MDRLVGFPATPRFAVAVITFPVKRDPTAYIMKIVLIADLVTFSPTGTINERRETGGSDQEVGDGAQTLRRG